LEERLLMELNSFLSDIGEASEIAHEA